MSSRNTNVKERQASHHVNYLERWSLPHKKMNLCVCGNETKSKVLRLSSEGSYEIFCKDCREMGDQD